MINRIFNGRMVVMDSGSRKRVWAGIGAKIHEIIIHAQNALPRNQLFTSAMPFVDASGIGQPSESKTAQVDGEDAGTGESSQFGGPSSVRGTIDKDRETEAAVPFRVRFLNEYIDFKKRVEKEHAFAFGFDYNALYQVATESLGEDDAAGGAFRAFGHWTLVGRDTEDRGSLIYKIENRHDL